MSFKPVTDYIYNGAEMLSDPDGVFDRLRAEGDVLWSPSMRRWLILSRTAALEALRHKDLRVYDVFKAFDHVARLSGAPLDDLITVSDWIPFLHDGARHKQLRNLFATVLAEIKEPYLDAYAKGSEMLLAEMQAQGGGDFASQYADRVHVEAFGRLCGIALVDRAWLAEASSSEGAVDFAVSVPALIGANARAGALLGRVDQIMSRTPNNAVLARIGHQLEAAGLPNTHETRVEFLASLTLLGRDTLSGTLTLGLAKLLDDHGGRMTSAMWPDPKALTNEIFRLTSAVQIVNRVATKPVTISGQTIAEGEILMIYLPAANRDPSVFACPHQYGEDNPAGIAFGSSRHLCVGMPMAQKSTTISLQHLSQFSAIIAADGCSIGQGKNTRKYGKLPVLME